MLRFAFIFAIPLAFCCQGTARAELLTHTFGFPTMVGPDIPTTLLSHTVSGADADFTFDVAISAASGTPVYRGSSGGLGVSGSPGESFSTIDNPGEDLTFALTVTVSNINPNGGNITATEITFGEVTIKFAGGPGPDFDSGSFSSLLDAGPGAPNFPGNTHTYTWVTGTTTTDFPGMTPDPLPSATPAFDLYRMNGAPVATFTHTFVGGSFLFNDLDVSVVAAPEPSSWALGLLASLLIIFRLGWKRIRPRLNPVASV